MRQRGRWLSSGIGILVVVTACAGPASAPSAGPSDRVAPAPSSGPKRVTAVIRGAPFALAAAVNEIGAGSVPGVDQVEQLLNAGLSGEDLEGRIQPRLAEQVPSVENGLWKVFPDGRMETTWHLRPNLSWHDGAPFTSDDLVFAMQVAQEPRAGFAIGQAYELIEKVEAPDARTFTLTWSKPFIRANALFGTAPTSNLRLMPLPRHLLERPFLEDPTSLPSSHTGPVTLSASAPSSSSTTSRGATWRGGRTRRTSSAARRSTRLRCASWRTPRPSRRICWLAPLS
jgi:ABC-type transport system substrate-binding protein